MQVSRGPEAQRWWTGMLQRERLGPCGRGGAGGVRHGMREGPGRAGPGQQLGEGRVPPR